MDDGFEARKQELILMYRREHPDVEVIPDEDWLEICGAARIGRKTLRWV